jgi:hypothetical protein
MVVIKLILKCFKMKKLLMLLAFVGTFVGITKLEAKNKVTIKKSVTKNANSKIGVMN